MSIIVFYRFCIWLPVLIPAALIIVVNLFGLNDLVGWVGEAIAYSLLYGGIPYIALGLWATWWVGGRTEPEIRRLMLLAPLLMLVVFAAVALVVGLVVGALVPFTGVAALGGAVIIPLGYTYVGLTELLRSQLGGGMK